MPGPFPKLSTLLSFNFLAINLDSSRTHGNHFRGSVNGYIENADNDGQAIAQQTTIQHDSPRSPETPPDSKADYDIYYDQLLLRKRGCPLYSPGPLGSLPVEYRRTGTRIGDIGIVYRSGFFDYLFNILCPADHPINRGRVPQGFAPFDFAPAVREEADGEAFSPGSSLASACLRKSGNNDASDSDFLFETTDNEGAVLVLPGGSNFKELLNRNCLKNYVAENADQWYSYITGPRGRGVSNGDVRLVVGFDKAHSWGIATFSCSQESGRLEFKKRALSGSFAWNCLDGIGNGKSGPLDDEIRDLRQSTDEPLPRNQTIFIRSMNFSLRGEITDDPDSVALEVRSGSRTAGSSKSKGDSSRRPASSSNQASSSVGGQRVGQQRGVNFSPDHFELPVIHPSTDFNRFLLDKYPNAKIAITDDWDWISVMREDDLAIPTSKDLWRRITESSQVYEKNGIATVCGNASSQDYVPLVDDCKLVSAKLIDHDDPSVFQVMSTGEISLLELGNHISRQTTHIRALKAYIDAARSLPDDNGKYAKEFRLDVTMEQKLQPQIRSSVALNKVLKSHSQTFHDTTFTDMICLIKEVKQLASDVKDDYPLLYVSLRELIEAKKDGVDASNYQSDVRQLVEMNRDVPRKIQSKAVDVSAGLGKFEIQCTTDAADIAREMRYLGRDFQDDGELLNVVDELKKARDIAIKRGTTAQMIWAPFIGLLPHAVGRSNLGDRLRVLNKRDEEVITRQKVTLNYEMMESNWKSVHNLLKPAQQAVNIIRVFFEQLLSQLAIIQKIADNFEQVPPETRNMALHYIRKTENQWSRLEELVNHTLATAFNAFEALEFSK